MAFFITKSWSWTPKNLQSTTFFTHKTVSAVIYRWRHCNVLSSRQSAVNRLFIAPDDCVGRVRGSEDGGGSHWIRVAGRVAAAAAADVFITLTTGPFIEQSYTLAVTSGFDSEFQCFEWNSDLHPPTPEMSWVKWCVNHLFLPLNINQKFAVGNVKARQTADVPSADRKRIGAFSLPVMLWP